MPVFRKDDLLDDRSFTLDSIESLAHLDDLDHGNLAEQVGELARVSPGKVNIAIFGPWGAGKSSLAALIRRSLSPQIEAKQINFVTFDAWQYAGDHFPVNFLSEIADATGASTRRQVERSLFQSRKTVSLPLGLSNIPMWGRVLFFVGLLALVFLALPLLWTLAQQKWSWSWSDVDFTAWRVNVEGWLAYGISGSLVLIVGTLGLELTKASIEESEPSHTTQFRKIFGQLLKSASVKKLVVFVDELDRCSSDQLMQTLEGLRTFLGHDQVVFIAAFDRDAVAATVVRKRKVDLEADDGDTPYYLTAGEYLDKIFQYQLSMPPQSSHTMRRFALASVESREGVWGQLKGIGRLESVVSLLCPAHIRSPRRAKVLLNDFAVNVRAFEQLVGDAWIDRATEIAVWTVFQTEFPHLAADMIVEPDLPHYLLDDSETPTRDSLSQLVKRYRSKSEPLDVTTEKAKGLVGVQQHADLKIYLERIQALRVPRPKSDLIWRTKSRAFEDFDDQGLVDVLVRAPDRTVRASLHDLEDATAGDVSRAISFLARTAEEEFVDEARLVASLMGELADIHSDDAVELDDQLLPTWRRVAESGVSWCTPGAARGFARAIVRHESPAVIAGFSSEVLTEVQDPEGFVEAIVEAIPMGSWAANAKGVSLAVTRDIGRSFDGLGSVLEREDRGVPTVLTPMFASALAEALKIPDPEEAVPENNTTQSRQAAVTENAERAAAVADRRAATVARLEALQPVWAILSEEGSSRRWLLSFLRMLEESLPDVAQLHDNLIARVADDQTLAGNAILAIDALADRPEDLARWEAPSAALEWSPRVSDAIGGLLRLAATTSPTSAAAVSRIDSIGVGFSSLREQPTELPWIEGLTAQPASEARDYLLGLCSVQRRFGSEEAAGLQSALLLSFAPRSDLTLQDKMGLAGLVDGKIAVLVGNELRTSIPELEPVAGQEASSFLIALAAKVRSSGTEIPVPISVVRMAKQAANWPSLLPAWLESGPKFAHVTMTADTTALMAIDPNVWREYGRFAGERSVTAAWLFLRRNGAPAVTLRALAAGGVGREVYDAVAESIATGDADWKRNVAVSEYLSLPQDTRASAGAAAAVIARLGSLSRSGDYKYAADLALANSTRFTSSERDGVRRAIARFRPPIVGNILRNMGLRAAGF